MQITLQTTGPSGALATSVLHHLHFLGASLGTSLAILGHGGTFDNFLQILPAEVAYQVILESVSTPLN
jgi:hypothetical protein